MKNMFNYHLRSQLPNKSLQENAEIVGTMPESDNQFSRKNGRSANPRIYGQPSENNNVELFTLGPNKKTKCFLGKGLKILGRVGTHIFFF